MRNKAMQRKIESGEAIDLAKCERTPEGYYILLGFEEDTDYCDSKEESWIWSIGKRNSDGVILASTSTIFYDNPDYQCLFLR